MLTPPPFEPLELPRVVCRSCSSAESPCDALVLLVPQQPDAAPAAAAAAAGAAAGASGVAEEHTSVSCCQPQALVVDTRPMLRAADEASVGALRLAMRTHSFSGKKGLVLPPIMLPAGASLPGLPPARQLLLIGLGKQQQQPLGAGSGWGPTSFHAAGAALGGAAKSYRLERVAVCLSGFPGADAEQAQHSEAAQQGQQQHAPAAAAAAAAAAAFVAAALVGLYDGSAPYKSKFERKARLAELQLCGAAADAPGVAAAAARGVAYARGTLMARFLVDAPANVCTPRHLAAAAAHLAALDPRRFSLQVLDEAACRGLGMGLFVGVSQGSDEPLQFIHLTYTPPGPVAHKVALVGKAVTFDSGGLNLKVQGGIETMKCDMGGAAAVLGAARVIAAHQPAGVQVHFIAAAAENMVSGKATRPSDIHVSASGLTVEVNDTDAEGRLTLADALWYAQHKAGAQSVVDIATLTGAAGIALGQDTGALFANGDGIAAEVAAASLAAGEKLWRMPLNQDLRCKLDSPIADLKNYAGRWGGAITAALFLHEFVEAGTRWAHLDVAGPAWDDTAGVSTGFGAATLAGWVCSLAP